MEIKENIPCTQFKECQKAGGIKNKATFSINGIDYYTFEKDLQMISANRFLLYQQDLATRQNFGMSDSIATDYLKEIESYHSKIEKYTYDQDYEMLIKTCQEQRFAIEVLMEHKNNANLVALLLEFAATCFISPCEDPYVVDYDLHNKKIISWGLYLGTEEGASFMPFFWKACSNGEQDWIRQLVSSMRHLGLNREEMTEQELIRVEKSEFILGAEILKHKSHMEDLISNRNSSAHVRQLRTMLSYLKRTLNPLVYRTISNIQS